MYSGRQRHVWGKSREFYAFAKRARDYWTEHFPEIREMETCSALTGDNTKYVWVLKYESLAAWEKTVAQSDADAGWSELAKERLP